MSPKITPAQRENKRNEILDAAMRVFIRQGYQTTTMKDVVEESGLSRGGVYLYFSSTEQMLMAIIKEFDASNDQQIDELLAQYPTVWSALSSLFDHLLTELEDIEKGMIPVLYEALITEWRKKTYEELMFERYPIAVGRIVQMLQEGVKRGEFQPLIPIDTISRMFVTISDGIMIHATQFGAERIRGSSQVDAFLQTFKHLLGVKEEEASK